MKIALTGTSSTGKTTLAKALLKEKSFYKYVTKFLSADARSILDKKGFHSMDRMTKQDIIEFQREYVSTKSEMENLEDNFITDRSFVDCASYWLIRDTFDMDASIQNTLISECYIQALKYDLHIYLPFGIIPFESDGYRSENIDIHERIDEQINSFLIEWHIKYLTLGMDSLEERIRTVIKYLEKYYD